MSRRDTIIIAVLVNAGLLMILFATAMHTDKGVERMSMASSMEVSASGGAVASAFNLPPDEVDRALARQGGKAAPQQVVLDLGATPAVNKVEVPTVEVASDAQQGQVVVRRGDYLERIARAHGTTVEKIMELNQLTSGRLSVGQVLKVPAPTNPVVAQEVAPTAKAASTTVAAQKAPRKEVAVQDSAGAVYYTVKSGDTPWHIASKNGIKLDDLLRLNNLDEAKARQLKPGDQLRIR